MSFSSYKEVHSHRVYSHDDIMNIIQSEYKLSSKVSEIEYFQERYSNIKYFGNGAFGLIFEVWDKKDKVKRLVKKSDINTILKYHTLEEWIEIIENITHADSEYIGLITDRLYYMSGFIYLVMKQEHYGNLEDFMSYYKTNCFSQRASKYIIEQSLFALDDLESINLIHRDIKTKNFVIAGIEDFNKKQDKEKENSSSESEKDKQKEKESTKINYYDKQGCLDILVYIRLIDFDFIDFRDKKHKKIGAAYYMSPQIENNLDYDNPDIFSLGMMWYKLLTGYYMTSKAKEYKEHLKDKDTLHSMKLSAFNSPHWIRVAVDEYFDTDRDYIRKMCTFDEAERPTSKDLLKDNYFVKDSHVFNDIRLESIDAEVPIQINDLVKKEDMPIPGKSNQTNSLKKNRFKLRKYDAGMNMQVNSNPDNVSTNETDNWNLTDYIVSMFGEHQ